MTDAINDASRWSWIAPDGRLGSGLTRELTSALQGGGLPPGTFVWKATWLEWIPANRVAELATAIPGGPAAPLREPKRAASALAPPFRPREAPSAPRGPELPRPPQAAKRDGADAADAGRPSSFGLLGKPRGMSVLGPPSGDAKTTAPPREPLPTLGEEPSDTKATLRPPGAVPPPPRLVQAPAFRPAPVVEEHPTPRKAPALGSAATSRDTISDSDLSDVPALLPSEIRTAVVLPGTPSTVSIRAQPPKPSAAPELAPPAPDLDSTLGSTPFEAPPSIPVEVEPPSVPREPAASALASESTSTATAPVSSPRVQSSRAPAPRSLLIGMVLLAAIVALLAAGMVALTVRRSQEVPAAVASTPVVPVAAAKVPAPPQACRLLEPAARLAGSVHRAVPPLLTEVARGERIALGLAEAPKNAAGLIVNLATLDVERAFEQAGDKPLFSVVPLIGAGAVSFVADRSDAGLGGARTLAPGLVVGVSGTDLVRSRTGAPSAIWAGAASEKITDPRVSTGSAGHLVVFRRGGLSGRVFYGWLEPDGAPHGELTALEAPNVTQSGTPDAASNGNAGLVAFAARPSAEAEWRIQLAAVPKGGKPIVRGFEVPPGGPGGGSIAPAVSALGADGWLLQWTEGTSGKYQVREQRLDAALAPIGEPWLVSPKGANAGQGAVLASGSRVLSVFVQTTAGHDELWGASFECF